jgi:hypothetical protein
MASKAKAPHQALMCPHEGLYSVLNPSPVPHKRGWVIRKYSRTIGGYVIFVKIASSGGTPDVVVGLYSRNALITSYCGNL